MLSLLFFLGLMFQAKHLVVDFMWQPEYEWRNKGTFGHWGGIRHSLKHAMATVGLLLIASLVFKPLGLGMILLLAAIEFTIHYCVDWGKMNLNARLGLDAGKEKFWWLLGLDQFLHQMTYVGFMVFVASL